MNSSVQLSSVANRAVTDRRLRPRCCHLGKRPKSSPVRASVGLQLVLLRTVYSQAQGCVFTALELGGDVEQPLLSTSSIKPEVHNHTPPEQDRATARGLTRIKKNLVKIGSVVPKI